MLTNIRQFLQYDINVNMYHIQIFYYIHTEFPSKMAKKLFPIQFKMFQEESGFRIHIQSITISVLLARESLSRQSYEFHDLFLKLQRAPSQRSVIKFAVVYLILIFRLVWGQSHCSSFCNLGPGHLSLKSSFQIFFLDFFF